MNYYSTVYCVHVGTTSLSEMVRVNEGQWGSHSYSEWRVLPSLMWLHVYRAALARVAAADGAVEAER